MDQKPRVFISHSRHDDQGRLFVSDLFRGSGFEPDFYPLENKGPPHAEQIRNRIRLSTSIFVVLSDLMLGENRKHTRAWVGYEVGIATERNMPVVVVEPEGVKIDLPVPGATHYIRRPRNALDGLSAAWKHLAKTAGLLVESESSWDAETPGEKILEFLYNVATADFDTSGLFKRAKCEYTDCLSRFYVPDGLFGSARIPCPSCRTEVASFRVKMLELSKAAERAAVGGEKKLPDDN